MPGRDDLHVRPFVMPDCGAVRELWASAGQGLHLRPSDEPEELAKKLGRDPDLFLVAESNGKVVGVVIGAWDGRRGWIHHLAVAQGHRRQGVATRLMGEVEERLRAKGCLKANLLVFRDNAAARAFYQQLGYSEMEAVLPMGKEL